MSLHVLVFTPTKAWRCLSKSALSLSLSCVPTIFNYSSFAKIRQRKKRMIFVDKFESVSKIINRQDVYRIRVERYIHKSSDVRTEQVVNTLAHNKRLASKIHKPALEND